MPAARIAAAALLVLSAGAAAAIPLTTCGPDRGAWRLLRLVADRAGAVVCHQQPDRSLESCGRRWVVCGRCSGLYLGAGVVAWLALVAPWHPPRRGPSWWRAALLAAAAPTAALWLIEVAGLATIGTSLRLAGAVPLGAAGALWLWTVARGDLR